jgi:hypothetical protein
MPKCEQCGTSISDDDGVVLTLNHVRIEMYRRVERYVDPVPVTLCRKCATSYLGLFRFCLATVLTAIATAVILKLLLDWLD